ncbi:MAG TPA: AmmeMemoRadiSam system protein B [Treponemataceae bacterium]|nr:AmmeMemoRadiSam system protein B [Treponemataceae bacterium]
MCRKMSFAGAFYPARPKKILDFFDSFNNRLEKEKHPSLSYTQTTKAIIVPHAGYMYSGYTANAAYRIFAKQALSNIVVIGPSHHQPLHGISLCQSSYFQTPLGTISNAPLEDELKNIFSLRQKISHEEHSTEVQFPFIKHYHPKASIVEIIYGLVKPIEVQKIIEHALLLPDTGVIISTDLSHFHPLTKAKMKDSLCLKGIETLDASILSDGCEACGLTGIKAMINAAQTLKLTPHIIDYRTSADASKDSSRVVGYASAIFV